MTQRFLGVGIGWRRKLHNELLEHRTEIDFVEVLADDFFDADGLYRLAEVDAAFAWVPHGTQLSIGSAEGIDASRVEHLRSVLAAGTPPWWSEHLAFTRAGGTETDALQPMWFTSAAVAAVVENVSRVRERLPHPPLLLENIAYYVRVPYEEMDEAEFIRRVLVDADLGLLLDVSNLHVNATNFGYEPHAFLDRIPLDRVVQVHVGGSREAFGVLYDSHADPVAPEAWALLEEVLRRAPVRAVSLERDGDMPPLRELLDELARIRRIWRNVGAPV